MINLQLWEGWIGVGEGREINEVVFPVGYTKHNEVRAGMGAERRRKDTQGLAEAVGTLWVLTEKFQVEMQLMDRGKLGGQAVV